MHDLESFSKIWSHTKSNLVHTINGILIRICLDFENGFMSKILGIFFKEKQVKLKASLLALMLTLLIVLPSTEHWLSHILYNTQKLNSYYMNELLLQLVLKTHTLYYQVKHTKSLRKQAYISLICREISTNQAHACTDMLFKDTTF